MRIRVDYKLSLKQLSRDRRIRFLYSCPPAICRRWVRLFRIAQPRGLIDVLAVRAAGDGVVVPEESSGAQLREEERDDIVEGAWLDCVCLEGCLVLGPYISASFASATGVFRGERDGHNVQC